MVNLNPFYVLKVPHTATDQDVREAYLTAVKRYPPERFPAMFNEINSAYKEIQTQRDRLYRYLFCLPPPRTLAEMIPDMAPQRNALSKEDWMILIRSKNP
jgi:hypothetical protein